MNDDTLVIGGIYRAPNQVYFWNGYEMVPINGGEKPYTGETLKLQAIPCDYEPSLLARQQ